MPNEYKTVYCGGPMHGHVHHHSPQYLYHNRLVIQEGWTYQLQSVQVGADDWYFYYALGPKGQEIAT